MRVILGAFTTSKLEIDPMLHTTKCSKDSLPSTSFVFVAFDLDLSLITGLQGGRSHSKQPDGFHWCAGD